MLRRFTAIMTVVLSAWLATGRVAQAQPATAPTTALVPADSSTPKGTLILLSRATMTGESEDVKDLFHATNPQEQKLAAVLLNRTVVYAKFRKALVGAFGEDAAAQLTQNRADDEPIAEQRISQAEMKIDGDKASVQMKADAGQEKPDAVELVKVDNKWKLPVGKLTEGMKESEVESRLKEFTTLSDVVSQITGEIGQTKYKSIDEVADAMRAKIATAVLSQSTTQPAQQP